MKPDYKRTLPFQYILLGSSAYLQRQRLTDSPKERKPLFFYCLNKTPKQTQANIPYITLQTATHTHTHTHTQRERTSYLYRYTIILPLSPSLSLSLSQSSRHVHIDTHTFTHTYIHTYIHTYYKGDK